MPLDAIYQYKSREEVALAKSFWEINLVVTHLNGPDQLHLGLPMGPVLAQSWFSFPS